MIMNNDKNNNNSNTQPALPCVTDLTDRYVQLKSRADGAQPVELSRTNRKGYSKH